MPIRAFDVQGAASAQPKYAGMSDNDVWRKMNFDAGRPEPPDFPAHKRLDIPDRASPISAMLAELLQLGTVKGQPSPDDSSHRLRTLDDIDEMHKGIRNNSPDYSERLGDVWGDGLQGQLVKRAIPR